MNVFAPGLRFAVRNTYSKDWLKNIQHGSFTPRCLHSGSSTGATNLANAQDKAPPPAPLKAALEGIVSESTSKETVKKLPAVAASEDALARGQENSVSVLRTLGSMPAAEGTPRRKKKKKKKDVASSSSASSVEPREGWTAENWGEDELAPPDDAQKTDIVDNNTSKSKSARLPPPHIRPPLAYTRRIEGLLHSNTKDVLEGVPPPSEQRPIARLAHGLDRVLFNPSVHWLQDPRSRVYNFTTWLESIPNVKDFAFERIEPFVKSSRDQDLWALCNRENRAFGGSTSSLTGMLSQIYFLVSGDKDVDIGMLSRWFQHEPTTFTPGQRMPVSVIFNHNDGKYAIDSDSMPGESEKNILVWLGTLLEKFLTVPEEHFKRLLRSSPNPLEENKEDPRKEAFRYSKSERFVMRSQLDAQDTRLPGTGVFDIKTRATLPIRLDMLNYEENSGYLIRHLQGPLESFEKEYYDLIRSAFLKYSFQARIGNMDGVLVAYHNTARMFGFQYVPLEEMEGRLYGGKKRGGRVFEKCVGVLELVADEMVRVFPGQSMKATFETLEGSGIMNVWIEPLEWNVEAQGPWPIAQLDVSATSYLGDTQVSGTRAISAYKDPWTLHWTISRSSSTFGEIRANLAQAKERQTRAYNLPTGVKIEEMEEVWNKMNFGKPVSPSLGSCSTPSLDRSSSDNEPFIEEHVIHEVSSAPFVPGKFRTASKNILELRELAKAGRESSEAEARKEQGKRKIVWGEPEVVEVEAGEAAEEEVEDADAGEADVMGVVSTPDIADVERTEAEAYIERRETADPEASLPGDELVPVHPLQLRIRNDGSQAILDELKELVGRSRSDPVEDEAPTSSHGNADRAARALEGITEAHLDQSITGDNTSADDPYLGPEDRPGPRKSKDGIAESDEALSSSR